MAGNDARAGPPALTPARPGPTGLVFLGVVLLFCAGVWASGATLDPTARDQVHDLSLAIRVREGTALSDGNRHPLLPALLSPVARREPGFMTDARAISVVVTALVLLLFYRSASRAFSGGLALLAAALWLFELRFQARRICPEPLVAGLLVAATSALARAPSAARRPLAYLSAGAWAGAAWLAKGSALLVLPAFVGHLVLARRLRGLGEAGLVLLGFAAAAAPLLLYNTQVYGSPAYNSNSAHVMWEDAWDQELDLTSKATMGSWLERHGAADALARLSDGLLRQRGVEWPCAFLALALAARLLLRGRGGAPRADAEPGSPPREWRRIAVLSCLVWLPAFAWYAPIVSSRRLLFPLFGVLLPPALDVVSRLLPAAWRRLRVPAAAGQAAAALLVAAAALVVALTPNPWARSPVSDASMAVVRNLSSADVRGARVLVRPSRTYPPDWLLEGQVRFTALPAAVADRDAPAWIEAHADYVLLNEGLLLGRRGAFANVAGWDAAKGISLREGGARGAFLVRDEGRRVVYAVVPSRALFRR